MVSHSTRQKAKEYARQNNTNYTTALRAITSEKTGRSQFATSKNQNSVLFAALDDKAAAHALVCTINHAHPNRAVWPLMVQAAEHGFDVSYYPHLGSENDQVNLASIEARMHQAQEHLDGHLSLENFPHGELDEELQRRFSWLEKNPQSVGGVLQEFMEYEDEPIFRPLLVVAEIKKPMSRELEEIALRGRSVAVHLVLIVDDLNLVTPEAMGCFGARMVVADRRESGRAILDFQEKNQQRLGMEANDDQIKQWHHRSPLYRNWREVEKPLSEQDRRASRFDALLAYPGEKYPQEVTFSEE